MFRDFSQEAKEKLISYVNDTSSDGIWQIIKNSIDYMDVKIKNWLHTLDSYAYLSQMDGYYQTVLNKHDTTIEQIEQIFTAVECIYSDGLYIFSDDNCFEYSVILKRICGNFCHLAGYSPCLSY